MSEIVNRIKYAMSLRTPQEEALSYLDAISSQCDYKKDAKDTIESVASKNCENQRTVKSTFDFPSFCYAMATGIGKTRLMGASIYYLYKTKGYTHFFMHREIPFTINCAKNAIPIIQNIFSKDWNQK